MQASEVLTATAAIDAEIRTYQWAAGQVLDAIINGDDIDRANAACSLAALLLGADDYRRAVAHWSECTAARTAYRVEG